MTAVGLGIVGRKIGMSRFFSESGASIPVTVIASEPHRVIALRTASREGYDAVQVACGERRRVEFRLDGIDGAEALCSGAQFGVTIFSAGQKVDVSGRSKGKGFQGGIKRWNFSRQDATHGNSLSHRSNGSIGQCQTPGRVWKGKKMSGHMGDRNVTTQGLEIVTVDVENSLLLVRGAVPGANGGEVLIMPAVKAAPVPLPDVAVAEPSHEGGSEPVAESGSPEEIAAVQPADEPQSEASGDDSSSAQVAAETNEVAPVVTADDGDPEEQV